eukprot:TRINITY_DN7908_c0_g1_i15.p1 TRINITY_DN7908_c0_g1~~TRINITY_DN7908_c0_g1_i15.p1  ORF type:complete len:433 (+),score=65.57 TRINITY_DN7908_c0_g1_i15:59-1300(+)
MALSDKCVVYGMPISYFTGKLEAYLRYREIPYEHRLMTVRCMYGLIQKETGASQMPAVLLPDGRWMTDTSAIIMWFEQEINTCHGLCFGSRLPPAEVLPAAPEVCFVAHLIEDYGDEYMWRSAMHYRWSYPAGCEQLGNRIASLSNDTVLPHCVMKRVVRLRQYRGFVVRDGVTPSTVRHVEKAYRTLLALLSDILKKRPFVLGQCPTVADFGLFASLFRHFAEDPDPRAIMLAEAPTVYDWVKRMWDATASATEQTLPRTLPDDMLPLLQEIAETHLVQMHENARAHEQKRTCFDMTLQGTHYVSVPTSAYRAQCWHTLQGRFLALPPDARSSLQRVMEQVGGWQDLWDTMPVMDTSPGVPFTEPSPFAPGVKVHPEYEPLKPVLQFVLGCCVLWLAREYLTSFLSHDTTQT